MSRWVLVLVLLTGCGKTVFSGERFACESQGECAVGFECHEGECRPVDGGVKAGTDGGVGAACGTSACEEGLTCVEGVCCRTACDSPCASCSLVGFEGNCLPRPAGSDAPSCSGYACDGASLECAASCSAASTINGCNKGFTCVARTCGRCWSSVKNDFSTVDDPNWALLGAELAGGKLAISVTSRNGNSSLSKATSTQTLPLVGCAVTFELASAPSVVTGYEGRAALWADSVTRRPSFAWHFDTRGLVATWAFADGGMGEEVLVPAGTAPPRWLRLEERAGEVRWQATNGTVFSTLHSVAHEETLTGMKLEFSGSFPPQPGNDRVTFWVDSLNSGP